ncbi:MAG TPA: nucleolar RNA-binding Nop10p family protein [Candidatus Norongarragalinales archaeon]|nr:nucleolar RNA-binding Nop10p family protein [Candidatus Norongarragalinales archaeon]
MAFLLKHCGKCGAYTLEAKCPKCSADTSSGHPMKYSKEDRYALYRRKELFPQFFK